MFDTLVLSSGGIYCSIQLGGLLALEKIYEYK